MTVLVDRLDPQRQSGKVGRDLEGGAVGTLERQIASRQQDDVLENAAAWVCFELPEVGHRTVDQALRITRRDVVAIAHPGHADSQYIAHDYRAAVAIRDSRTASRFGIESIHQHQLVIGELQAFDMQQGIGAVTARYAVCHRIDVVLQIVGTAVVDGHRILVLKPGENGGVEGLPVSRGAGHDFPHGLELTRVDGAVQHERNHIDHAVEGGDFGTGMVDVSRIINGNPDVDPFVTVDQVIATATLDQVTAIAAEDDVASGKAGGRQSGIGQELVQSADQRDIGQRTARGTTVVDDGVGIDIIAPEHIAETRTGQALDLGKTVENRGRRGPDRIEHTGVLVWRIAVWLCQRGHGQVGGHAGPVILVGHPVETGHAVHLVLSVAAGEDVIATLADHFVEAGTTDKDVVAYHVVIEQRRGVIARRTVLGAHLDPVITFATGRWQVGLGTENEVITPAAEGKGDVFRGDDEILAIATQDQVSTRQHAAGHDHIVTVITFQTVVAERVADDVIARAAQYRVVPGATFETVVAAVAVKGVITLAGNEDVIAGGAAHDDMVFTGVLQVIGVWTHGVWVVANHQRHDFDAVDQDAARRVGSAVRAKAGELSGLIHLEGERRCQEHSVRQVGDIGVEHDQLGKGVVFQLGAEVQARGTRQVVEAVAVLQRLHLGFKHEVEGRAEHAAERHLLFGEATDPEVDVVHTGSGDAIDHGVDARTVKECHAIR
ncbi:hypothetical protein D3C86_1022760 [compost metagenome]